MENDQRLELIHPAWKLPVGAVTTTRSGGVSEAAYACFNLGDHVGDDALTVAKNRALLAKHLNLRRLVWVQQVHGINVHRVGRDLRTPDVAVDALWTDQKSVGLCILTADCLPIFIADADGSLVAMVHGGWRSLAGGIIQKLGVRLLGLSDQLVGWIGPGISAANYQVGEEFISEIERAYGSHVAKQVCKSRGGGDWFADLNVLASWCMQDTGIHVVGSSGFCSYADRRFYSYRKQQITGRMASVIWIP